MRGSLGFSIGCNRVTNIVDTATSLINWVLAFGSSTFTRASTVNVWGFVGDPSASNGPRLISVPTNVEGIVGGRWTGTQFVTTTTTGATLHPFENVSTSDGVVKKFTTYANREDSTAYTTETVRLVDDNGIKVWATCTTAGTTGASAPSFSYGVDSTVTDGTAVWTIGGLATIDGTLLEDASTNKLLNSDAPATQTTASLGTGNWTLSVYGSGSAICSAGTATITGESAATEGAPNTINVTGAGTVTVTVTGSLDYFQLESGTFPTSIIITAGAEVTRAATTLSDTTSGRLTASSGAGRIVVTPEVAAVSLGLIFGTAVNAANYFALYASGNNIIMQKLNAGVPTNLSQAYTYSPTKTTVIDFYYNGSGSGLRVFDAGSTEPAFTTNANTDDIKLGTTFSIGSLLSLARFDANYLSVELSDNKADFGW